MIINFELNSKKFVADMAKPLSISIPLNFHGDQPNFFSVAGAEALTIKDKDFVGDTREGGSCNVEEYRLIPHGNGTHTESVGHIVDERTPVGEALVEALIPSTLITVKATRASDTRDKYEPKATECDFLITKESLASSLKKISDKEWLRGLIIRTLPNPPTKKNHEYGDACFFSNDAMEKIVSLGVRHLVVDIPSLDRTNDDGKMSNHRLFWRVGAGSKKLSPETNTNSTVTEMAFVPDEIKDGVYLMNLQIPNFVADAAPSRPILYEVKEV